MNTLLLALTAFFAFLLTRLVVNWYKLRTIPGPPLAALTDFWRAYYQYRGLLREKLVKLHKELGPIVRYGVSSVSISHPSAIEIIYGSRAGFTTADSYNVLIGIVNGKEVPSLVSTQDEARHGALRKSVAGAFGPTKVLDYEVHLNATIPVLLRALAQRPTFDCVEWVLYYTMDAAARTSFSESLGCLEAGEDVGGSIQIVRDRFNHWGWWSAVPWLERLVFRNPVAMRMKRTPSSMAATASGKMRAREASEKDGSVYTDDLLQRFLEASKVHPDALDTSGVIGMLMSTISGAGDTTALTIVVAVYNLLQHPVEAERLLEELREANISGIPSHAQVSKLPFLNAVIKESMRLFPTTNWPLERKVPPPGITVLGKFIPEGTSAGCLPVAIHLLNPDVWGDDTEAFRPGRWIDADADKLRQMEAAHLGFSRGKRVCLGQHIAVMSMKKVIAALFLRFQMSLVNPDAQLEADFSPAVACLRSLQVRIDKDLVKS